MFACDCVLAYFTLDIFVPQLNSLVAVRLGMQSIDYAMGYLVTVGRNTRREGQGGAMGKCSGGTVTEPVTWIGTSLRTGCHPSQL